MLCLTNNFPPNVHLGRAIAQAVSRRLPTATAWVRAQVRLCEICGGRSGTGASFL
jgi:H+/Cl- antiporter ClcA